MVWLYVVVAVWLLLGLLLYLAIISAFKCDVVVLLYILKDESTVGDLVELSRLYDDMPVVSKVVFAFLAVFASPFLFVKTVFKKRGDLM